ncbi:MAG: hypothetical protein K8R48_01215 [Alphaproteobacteria bacterium]|nr:hypothetical protein [Alphaproteobacteria bacterium]
MAYDYEFREQWDYELSELVSHGDCQKVRAFFDRAFWKGWKEPPTWDHLYIALQSENKPMLKLLVTWGAQATDEDMARLRTQMQSKDKYPHYLKLLRQAGLPLSAAALKEIPVAEIESPAPETLIPQEWKRVLRAFQQNGAASAFIGGEALCDLFNERGTRRKVDIFLQSVLRQDSVKENRRFLRAVFNASGFEVTEQMVKSFPDTAAPEAFPPPKDGKLPFHEGDYRHGITEIWTVIAGPQKTQYNIIFADRGDLGSSLQTPEQFTQHMLYDFDFGLNQIAYDGKQIITTPFYNADVLYQQIILKNLSDTSREHLLNLVKKYPDWKLCAESKKLLKPPPPPSHWYADLHGNIG